MWFSMQALNAQIWTKCVRDPEKSTTCLWEMTPMARAKCSGFISAWETTMKANAQLTSLTSQKQSRSFKLECDHPSGRWSLTRKKAQTGIRMVITSHTNLLPTPKKSTNLTQSCPDRTCSCHFVSGSPKKTMKFFVHTLCRTRTRLCKHI